MPISCLYAIERARMNFCVVVVAAPTAIVLFNYPLSLFPFFRLVSFIRIWSKARNMESNDTHIREMRTVLFDPSNNNSIEEKKLSFKIIIELVREYSISFLKTSRQDFDLIEGRKRVYLLHNREYQTTKFPTNGLLKIASSPSIFPPLKKEQGKN